MSYLNYDDLLNEHGYTKAVELFEAFRSNKPTQEISPDFAMQIIARLSDLYVKIEKIEWGLENPDSDSFLQWCQHYELIIPTIDARVFIEVGDSHYYVRVETAIGDSDDETFRHWENIPEYIEQVIAKATAPIYAMLVTNTNREYPFGVLTYEDALCVERLDDFWHSSQEERSKSIKACSLIVVNDPK